MNRAEILDNLRSGHAEWRAAVDQIPLDRMSEPMNEGGWSARDEIGHVTFYDRWTSGALRALARGDERRHSEMYDHEGDMAEYEGDINTYNEMIRQRYSTMSPAEMVEANRRAFDDLYEAAEALPEHMWDEPTEFTRDRKLGDIMAPQTWVHYAKHTPVLQAFLAQL